MSPFTWWFDSISAPLHAFHCLSRYPINHNLSDDILTQTWFIVLLGSIIAIIVFLFGAMVLFKRIQFIKQASLASMHHHHPHNHQGELMKSAIANQNGTQKPPKSLATFP